MADAVSRSPVAPIKAHQPSFKPKRVILIERLLFVVIPTPELIFSDLFSKLTVATTINEQTSPLWNSTALETAEQDEARQVKFKADLELLSLRVARR